MASNCYIHIPFCEKICSYCDFCKMFYNEKLVSNYLEELEKEINSIYKNEELETIYIGGGTPSSLSTTELERLFKILSILNKSKDIEYTIECNFENTTKEKLLLYKKYGINRLSFGLETTSKNNLEFLERTLDKNHLESILKDAKELGFTNINIDLMYALPNEEISDLEEDINYLLSLDIPHISTYSLIIEPHTKLSINNTKNILEDIDYQMYEVICNTLKSAGYNHYEISNFSKEGYASKHNLCYWNNNEYYGFGLGASSYLDSKRINNTRSINKYLNSNYIQEVEELSLEDKMEYEVILNLRKKEGISYHEFKSRYNKELKEVYNYQNLIDENLLEDTSKELLIREDKWYISNEIIVKMLGCEVNE